MLTKFEYQKERIQLSCRLEKKEASVDYIYAHKDEPGELRIPVAIPESGILPSSDDVLRKTLLAAHSMVKDFGVGRISPGMHVHADSEEGKRAEELLWDVVSFFGANFLYLVRAMRADDSPWMRALHRSSEH